MRARRLATIAAWINAEIPGLVARIEEGYCNTDRKIGRLRVAGKGRRGSHLIVHVKDHPRWIVLDHNSAETYRTNSEVEAWIEKWQSGVWWNFSKWTTKQVLRGLPWKG